MFKNNQQRADWSGLLQHEVKKLEAYVKVDVNEQWEQFLSNLTAKPTDSSN